jgi:WD40 repeat protein
MGTDKQKDSFSLSVISKANQQLSIFQDLVSSEGKGTTLQHNLKYGISPVTRIISSDIDSHMYAEYDNGIVRSYDVNSGDCLFEAEWNEGTASFENKVRSYLISPCSTRSKLKVFDLYTHSSFHANTNHTALVNAITCFGENYFLTIANDGLGKVYTTGNWRHVRDFVPNDYPHPLNYTKCALSFAVLNENTAAIGYDDGLLNVFDLREEYPIKTMYIGKARPISSITASQKIIFATFENKVYGFNMEGKIVKTLSVPFAISKISSFFSEYRRQSPHLFRSRFEETSFMDNLLFIATQRGPVYVYDIELEKIVRMIEGHNRYVTSMFLSPQHYVVTASVDGAIRRYNYDTKECTNIYYKYDGCRSIHISSDQKLMCVSGVIDNKAKLIDLETGTIKKVFSHQDSVRCVEFADIENQRCVFTSGWDRAVKQWNVETGELIKTFTAPGRICDIKITKNGLLFIGYYSRDMMGGFIVANISTGAIVLSSEQHASTERFGRVVVVRPNGDFLYTAGDDGVINKWDIQKGVILNTVECSAGVRVMNIDINQQILYSGHDDSTIKVWNLLTDKTLTTFNGSSGPIFSMAVTKDFLFTGGSNGRINKFDRKTNKLIDKINIDYDIVWDLCITPDGQTLISVSEDGMVIFFSIDSCKELGRCYNLYRGFLWTTPKNETVDHGYYWTDRLDEIVVTEENKEGITHPDEVEINRVREYHTIYNNQKLVMSRIIRSSFAEIHKISASQIKNKMFADQLLKANSRKLLKSGE